MADLSGDVVGLINSADKILVVGDGNLTYSLSLAQNLKEATIWATTYLTLIELYESYGKEDIENTIQ